MKFYKLASSLSPVRIAITLSLLIVQNNVAVGYSTWETSSSDGFTFIMFEKCSFKSNTGFQFKIKNISNIKLSNNIFQFNKLRYSGQTFIGCGNTVVIFIQYNEFSFNTADVIITLQRYLLLTEGTTLNISYNCARSIKKEHRSLIYFSTVLSIYWCAFQFSSTKGNLVHEIVNNSDIDFNVVFSNNYNYTSALYGTLLNSCSWEQNSAFHNVTPGDVFKRVIHYDKSTNILATQGATFCYCDNITGEIDCIRDNFTATLIYPGQTIPISLIQVPPYQITVIYPENCESVQYFNTLPSCMLVPSKSHSIWQFVYKDCVPLHYRAVTNYSKSCSVCFSAAGFKKYSYIYKLGFKKGCPLGFEINNGACDCNRLLKTAIPTLTCDIDTQTIDRPVHVWIGYTKQNAVSFVELCIRAFCNRKLNKL